MGRRERENRRNVRSDRRMPSKIHEMGHTEDNTYQHLCLEYRVQVT